MKKGLLSLHLRLKKIFPLQREFNNNTFNMVVGVDIISHNEKVHQYIKDNILTAFTAISSQH